MGKAIQLTFSSGADATEEDGIIWKESLRTGSFPMTPGMSGTVDKPFTVVRDGRSSEEDMTISMADLVESFNDGAFEHVTIPKTHKDTLEENTGYVRKVRIKDLPNGESVFETGLGFTEPDIKGQVQRGTIPNVSCGIFLNHLNKARKKNFRAALKHVNLTNVPWMPGLSPFPAIFASDDEVADDTQVSVYQFADELGGGTSTEETDKAEIVWDETEGSNWVREQVQASLNPNDSLDYPGSSEAAYYSVEDVSSSTALVREYYKGTSKRFVIPFSRNSNGEIEIAPNLRWTEAKEAMIAASDLQSKLDKYSHSEAFKKLAIALSDIDKNLVPKEIAVVGNMGLVEDRITKQQFAVGLSYRYDGNIDLDPKTMWVQTQEPQKAVKKPVAVVKLSDDPMDKLNAARMRRLALLDNK